VLGQGRSGRICTCETAHWQQWELQLLLPNQLLLLLTAWWEGWHGSKTAGG
jgi:hypothetical protein